MEIGDSSNGPDARWLADESDVADIKQPKIGLQHESKARAESVNPRV